MSCFPQVRSCPGSHTNAAPIRPNQSRAYHAPTSPFSFQTTREEKSQKRESGHGFYLKIVSPIPPGYCQQTHMKYIFGQQTTFLILGMETRKEPLKFSQKFYRQISPFLKMTQFDITRSRLFLIAKLKIISNNSCCPHSSHSACSKAFLWSSSGGHSRHCLLNWWQLILRHGFGSRANTPACIIDSAGHQRGGWGRKRGHTIREGGNKTANFSPHINFTRSFLQLTGNELGYVFL